MNDSLISAINNRLLQGVSFAEISELYDVAVGTLYNLDRKGRLAKCTLSRLDHRERHIASQLIQMRLKGLLLTVADIVEYPRYCPIFGMRITYLNDDPEHSATVVMISGSPRIVSKRASLMMNNETYEEIRKIISYVNRVKVGYDKFD